MKKIFNFIINIILLITLVLLVLIIISRLFGISIFGYYFCIVNSESMEPEYKKNSLVVIKEEKYENIEFSDVILFKSKVLSDKLILHRVIDKVETGYITKGDQTSYIDEGLVTENEYIGSPIFHTNTIAVFLIWLKKSYILVVINIFLLFILARYLKKRGYNNE